MSENKKRLDTVRLQEIVQGFWRSGALMAAVELGLFTAVSKGSNTFAEVAAALDITETNAERSTFPRSRQANIKFMSGFTIRIGIGISSGLMRAKSGTAKRFAPKPIDP